MSADNTDSVQQLILVQRVMELVHTLEFVVDKLNPDRLSEDAVDNLKDEMKRISFQADELQASTYKLMD